MMHRRCTDVARTAVAIAHRVGPGCRGGLWLSDATRMIPLLCIDPGATTGWAIFDISTAAPTLQACGMTAIDDAPAFPMCAHTMIIEVPDRVDPKSTVRDIITLALRTGRWIERARAAGIFVRQVAPQEWKGQVPKKIHGKRVLAALSFYETGLIPSNATHDCIDAIGLGLFHTYRLRR